MIGKSKTSNSLCAILKRRAIRGGINPPEAPLSNRGLFENSPGVKLALWGPIGVLVGGESGVNARPMKPEWVRSIMFQADRQKVAFFFKQWGTWGADGIKRNKKANGKTLDGKIIQMMPELAMRES